MKNIAIAGIIALSVLPALALAQTAAPQPAAPTATPAPPPAPSSSAGTTATAQPMSDMMGMKMANSATMAVRFVSVKPADIMTSKLVGMNIYNNQDEKVGEVDDLVIENGKTLTGLVVGVGGFLGMGESYVVLEPSTVVLNQQDGTWRAIVDTNKDTLKAAPKFQYSKSKS